MKMVAAGAEHTAAITEDGDLYGWGWGRYGNLGLGDRSDRLVPEKVSAVDVCLPTAQHLHMFHRCVCFPPSIVLTCTDSYLNLHATVVFI